MYLLESWAASLGVEVSFFLIDETASVIMKAAAWGAKIVAPPAYTAA